MREAFPDNLMTAMFWLQPTGMVHERKVYNIIRFVADVGGVLEIAIVSFAFIGASQSYFSFIMTVSESLPKKCQGHSHIDMEGGKKSIQRQQTGGFVKKQTCTHGLSLKK